MCLTEFDEEEAKRIWRRDGFTEGRTEKQWKLLVASMQMESQLKLSQNP